MTRVNLIKRIHAAMARATHGGPEPLTHAQIAWVLDEYGLAAEQELRAGQEVPVPRLGRLVSVRRRTRSGALAVPARVAVVFRPARITLNVLRGEEESRAWG